MSTPSTAGGLLLSVPQMLDPNFMHSVVVMCEHSSLGALGFVVNQPLGVGLAKLAPDHPSLGGLDFPVHQGGPVSRDHLQFLHREPERIPGGMPIGDGPLRLGGEVDALARFLREEPRGSLERVRLLLGYSGWAEGQLEAEMAVGSWVAAPLDLDQVFTADAGDGAWRRVMRSLGDEGEGLSRMPPDVGWN